MQKREQSLKSGQMPPPLWTLDSCNPCPLQTSRLGGQLFDLTRFRLNGLMACQCLCLLQTDSSITPKLTSQQASRGVSLCVSQVWMNSCHKTLTAVVPETYMHTEAHSWRHVHRGFVCLCVSVEACNPQNIKTRLTLVVPRKAVQKENCVCLCQEVLWCWTMVPLHLVMWCLCACMCVSVCHNACYGPQSSIGWPQLSWSHWRRFHRSVQRYSAILPGPKGASTSTHTLLHTHTQTHKDMHIHTHKFENTTDSHFYTKKHTAQLWNHTHRHIHT